MLQRFLYKNTQDDNIDFVKMSNLHAENVFATVTRSARELASSLHYPAQ